MIISLSFLIHNISTIVVSPSHKTVSVKWGNEYKDLRTVPGIQQTLSMSWGIVIILLVILIKFLDSCSRLSRYYSLSAPPVQLPVKRWVSLVEECKNCCPLIWNSQESFLSKSRFLFSSLELKISPFLCHLRGWACEQFSLTRTN